MAAEARFPIIIEGNVAEASKEASDAMSKLRDTILGGQSSIRNYNEQMRLLRGSSDDVAKAKTELKAKINAEQAAVTQATLALQKHGVTLGQLNDQARKAASAEAATAEATGGMTRTVDALRGLDVIGRGAFRRMNELKSAVSGAGGAMGIAVIGAVLFIGALVKLASAAVEAGVALGKFIVENANTQRNLLLTQEGLLGSAESARNFADQIDDMAKRVPTAKDELAKLGDELAGKGLKGQPLVDAMNAIAQTASAKGEAAGNKLKDKLVASLGAGAKEARIAAEKEFGALNARKLLDLNVQGARFKETLSGLTRDVNLEPLLKGLQEVLSFFDESSVSGAALHDLVTMVGSGFSEAVGESAPLVKAFMKQLLIYTLEGTILFLQLYHKIRDAFGPDTTGLVDGMNVALGVAKFAINAMVGSLVAAYAIWRALEGQVHAVVAAVGFLVDAATSAKKVLVEGWNGVGSSIVTGLVSGITGSGGQLAGAVTGLADKVKSGFKSALGIASPSKVFAEYGEHTAAGFEEGVSGSAGSSAANAVTAMAQPPSGGGAAGGARGGLELHVHIELGGAGGGGDAAKQLTQPSVLTALTKAVEDALAGVGLVPGAA